MIHLPPKPQPMTRRYPAAAFTLVEVLVVLVLLSILSGMVLTAVQGVTTSARMARTRSIIATVDSVIQEQYEAYKYRPFPVVIPDGGGITGTGNTISHEIIPSEAARVRLIMTRDLQRMEMPDKVSDVRQAADRRYATMPAVIRGMADRVLENPSTGELTLARAASGDLSQRSQFTVNWYTGSPLPTNNDRGHWPPRFSAYLRRTAALDPITNTIRWTPQHQGAECLYLILATTFSGGVSAIEAIPASNIGDTDGDGVPEILDGWGRPLGFIRWPIGFADPAIQTTVPDEFDPYRSDFGFLLSSVTAPYVVRPLVISAGADGEFGITFSPRQTNTTDEDSVLIAAGSAEEVNYATQTWPVNATWMGAEAAGRSGSYGYPDPFLRREIAGAGGTYLLPGQALLGTAANSYRADNISNFQLEATE